MCILERFGSLVVPDGNQIHRPGGAGGSPASTALFAGGAYDVYGTERIPRGARTVTVQTRILGSRAARQETLDSWYAAGNTRERLFRRSGTDVVQWQWARLIPPDPESRWDDAGFTSIDLTWLIYGDTWNGLRHGDGLELDNTPLEGFDEGLVLDYDGSRYDTEFALPNHAVITTKTLTLNDDGVTPPLHNDGNGTVTTIVATATAGNAAFTGTMTLAINGVDLWSYTGTIAATKSLVVHSGSYSVTTNTAGGISFVGAYAAFTEPATQMEWMTLGPGDNTASLRYTGGGTGAKLLFDYWSSWA